MMKKVIFPLFLLLLVTIVYTALFPVKVYNTNRFAISQMIDTTLSLAGKSDVNGVDGYYVTESECGFFRFDDGGVINKIVIDENKRVQANRYIYSTYDKVGNVVSLFLANGLKIKDVQTPSYPYIIEDVERFYFLKTNGTGFFAYNIEGEKMFPEVDYSSFITSMAASEYFTDTLVSNMDGATYLYTESGEVMFENRINQNDSHYAYTKGNALDKEGKYMATCSGLEPEYIEIFQKRTGNRVAKIETKTNFRYRPIMEFKKGRLYYEGEKVLEYYDIANKKSGKGFAFRGDLKELSFSDDGSVVILSKDEKATYLSLYSESGVKYLYKEFSKPIDNLRFVSKKSFYFRMDNRIIKMDSKESA